MEMLSVTTWRLGRLPLRGSSAFLAPGRGLPDVTGPLGGAFLIPRPLAEEPHSLLLLAISQTCRFQEKSFLKFLLSKETDLDWFRKTRPVRYSYAVGRQRGMPEPPSTSS